MKFHLLMKQLFAVAILARANAVNGVISNDQKPGSYREAHLDGSSFVVEDVVEEGDLEFYGVDVKHESKVIKEVDADVKTLEFFQNLLETSEELKYIENYEDVLFEAMTSHDLNLDQRDLVVDLPTVHCDQASNAYFFNVEIKVTPHADASLEMCDTQKQKEFGNQIENMLLDFGVGNTGSGDKVVFLAKVCNVPSIVHRLLHVSNEFPEEEMKDEHDAHRERLLQSLRPVNPNAFIYSGGGVCRGCGGDNGDRRKLASSSSTTAGSTSESMSSVTNAARKCVGSSCNQSKTYCKVSSPSSNRGCDLDFHGFVNDLNARVTQYMTDTVVSDNWQCCGTRPGIKVTIKTVSEASVNYGCRKQGSN